jgi:hypothetical protein
MPKLIIPDIHNKIDILDVILKKYSYIKEKIQLGDWHDSFEHPFPYQAGETARAQRDFIADPNHICLLGNHDMQYAFPEYKGEGLYCSGYGPYKQTYITEFMTREYWDKCRLFVWYEINTKHWLLSHAGFHPYFANPVNGLTEQNVHNICEMALESIRSNGPFPEILMAGRRRGGSHPTGGCTWLDYREFIPVPGVNQIVGHTIASDVRKKEILDSENYCIDTQLHSVVILDDDGVVTIEKL